MTEPPTAGLVLVTVFGLVAAATPVLADPGCEAAGVRLELVPAPPDGFGDACPVLARLLSTPEPSAASATTAVARRLSALAAFAAVDCDGDGADGRITTATPFAGVACRLRPRLLVRRASIDASLPFSLLTDDLRRRVFLRPGAPIDDDEALARQEDRLRRFLAREGHPSARVRVDTATIGGAAPYLGLELRVAVDAGPALPLGRVEVSGGGPIPDHEIEAGLRHHVLLFFEESFEPERFEEDVDALTRRLARAGHPGARVRARWAPDEGGEAIRAELIVTPGPKLGVRYEGLEPLDPDDVEDALSFESANAADALEIETSAEAIRGRLQRAGYPAATVKARTEGTDPARLDVVFAVDLGSRRVVRRIELRGARALPAERALEEANLITRVESLLARGRWVDAWIARDRRHLQAVFRGLGYGAAAVEARRVPVGEDGIAVVFEVTEGPRRTTRTLELVALPSELPAGGLESRLRLAPGRPFDDEALAADRRLVIASLAAAGWTDARVEVEARVPPAELGGEVDVRLVAHPGRRARFGGLWLRGAFRTTRGTILRELDMEPGDALDVSKVGRARRRLAALGLFGTIDLRLARTASVGASEMETWLLASLEEKSVVTLDLVLSFATDDLFSVGFDLRDRNLFGRAVRLEAEARLSNAAGLIDEDLRIGRRDRVAARLGVDRPFGAPFDLEGTSQLDIEDRALFRERRVGGGVAISRRWLSREACGVCPDLSTALGYDLASTAFDPRGELAVAIGASRATIGRVFLRGSADRLDDPIDPHRGYRVDARVELADPGLALGISTDARFTRLLGSAQAYLELGSPIRIRYGEDGLLGGPVVIGLAFDAATARPFGGGVLPITEGFEYGGDLSVRGLSRRATAALIPGARHRIVANAELRWYLLPRLPIGALQLAGFVDLGTVANLSAELFDETTISVGPALRWVTPVGPLSAAWGWPVLRPPRLVAAAPDAIAASGRFHLSLGYAF